METLKKTAARTGIVLTGICGVVLLGGGKIVSGTILIALTFLMASPLWRRIPRWVRVGLPCVLFGLVIWNISTTDLPAPVDEPSDVMGACISPGAEMFPRTGITFIDQMAVILGSFLDQAQPS